MKKMIPIAALLLCLVMAMSACSTYRDDVAVNDLTNAVLTSVSTLDGYVAADTDYIALEFANPDAISANVSEWMICASKSSQTVDEFGIFHVKEGGDVAAVRSEIQDYLNAMQVKLAVYLETYDPAEKDKLYNTQVYSVGNYVIYTMLSEQDTTAAQNAFKDALKK